MTCLLKELSVHVYSNFKTSLLALCWHKLFCESFFSSICLPLTPLFLLYLVLGDTSAIAVMCAKGLHLPIFWSVCVTSFVCCVSRGTVDLKELLNCNIRLIKQRNIVCKATFLHELSWIKLFRTDQGHSSQLHFAYFGHVFLLRPDHFSSLLGTFMLCSIYTE